MRTSFGVPSRGKPEAQLLAGNLLSGIPAQAIETLRPGLADAFSSRPYEAMEITPEEIVVVSDWAYARGTYTVDAGGKHLEGKFLTIFRRQGDGSWRIFRDIFNPNS